MVHALPLYDHFYYYFMGLVLITDSFQYTKVKNLQNLLCIVAL